MFVSFTSKVLIAEEDIPKPLLVSAQGVFGLVPASHSHVISACACACVWRSEVIERAVAVQL